MIAALSLSVAVGIVPSSAVAEGADSDPTGSGSTSAESRIPKDPRPSKAGQGVPEGVDSLELLRRAIGTKALKNQEDLNDLKEWILTQPGVEAAGFYESAIDIENRSMTLLWHGNSPIRAKAISKGQAMGLSVRVKDVPYTRYSVERAVSRLLNMDKGLIGDAVVVSVAGPTLANDGLTVTLKPTGSDAATAKVATKDLSESLTKLAGIEVATQVGNNSVPYVTRSTDTTPFAAGGQILGSSGDVCTSGFAVKRSGLTWVTTARHCTSSSYRAFSLSSSSYGNKGSADSATGVRLLSGDGFFWMFDGAWNNASGYHKTVKGSASVSEGSVVCSSGANTGAHCGLKVFDTTVSFNDGSGSFTTIGVKAASGIAAGQGDSGGPVFIPRSDGTSVTAVGFIQGSLGAQTTSCGSIRIPGALCSKEMEFSSIKKFLSNMDATLYTG